MPTTTYATDLEAICHSVDRKTIYLGDGHWVEAICIEGHSIYVSLTDAAKFLRLPEAALIDQATAAEESLGDGNGLDFFEVPDSQTYTWLYLDAFVFIADALGIEPFSYLKAQGTDHRKSVAAMRRRRKIPNHLYVIGSREQGIVKIGISADPAKRLKEVQTGCPYKLELIHSVRVRKAKDLEFRLHGRLKDFALNGEWFDAACLPLIDWENL